MMQASRKAKTAGHGVRAGNGTPTPMISHKIHHRKLVLTLRITHVEVEVHIDLLDPVTFRRVVATEDVGHNMATCLRKSPQGHTISRPRTTLTTVGLVHEDGEGIFEAVERGFIGVVDTDKHPALVSKGI